MQKLQVHTYIVLMLHSFVQCTNLYTVYTLYWVITNYVGLISLKVTCKNNGYKTKSRSFFFCLSSRHKVCVQLSPKYVWGPKFQMGIKFDIIFCSLIFQKFGTHNHTESFIMTKEQLQSFFIESHRYSSNKIRKTQNEHLNIVFQNLNSR